MRGPLGVGNIQRSIKVRGRRVFTILRLGLVQRTFGDTKVKIELGVNKAWSHILSVIVLLHLPKV